MIERIVKKYVSDILRVFSYSNTWNKYLSRFLVWSVANVICLVSSIASVTRRSYGTKLKSLPCINYK